MFIIKLWNYLKGYIIIIFEGKVPERFINMCTNKGIFLWDIKKKGDEVSKAKIVINDFKKIRPIVRKTKVRVYINKKRGVPFLLNRYKKRRKILIIGILLFVMIIYILSLFIWSIEVVGNKTVPKEKIIQNLEELGVKRGAFRKNFDSKYLKNEMLIRMNEISWIKIDMQGTNVVVEVVEATLPPKIIEKDVPCNIVATKNGVISKIFVYDGIQKVSVNDTVMKGDLLVLGVIENKYGNVRYIHSLADIKIKTWYEDEIELYYDKNSVEETGNVEYKYTINLFGKLINFGDVNTKYDLYSKETINRQIENIPIGIIVTKYMEQKENIKDIPTEENLIEKGKNILLDKLEKKLEKDVEIVSIKNYTDNIKDGIKVRCIFECIENGGEQKKINL